MFDILSYNMSKLSHRVMKIIIIQLVLLSSFSSYLLNASTHDERKLTGFFKDYCIDCHNNKKQKGKLNLENIDHDVKNKQWIDILAVLEDFEMPPEDEKQPSDKKRIEMSELIKNMASHKKSPGYVSMRRMNRLEYDNSVRDLFNLKTNIFAITDRVIRESKPYFDPASGKMPSEIELVSRTTQRGNDQVLFAGVSSLPIDSKAEHGFENNARVSTLSPLLMEKYLSVAKSVLNSSSFPTKSLDWKKLFNEPTENLEAEVKKRLSDLIRKAFRKKLDLEQVNKYTQFFMSQYNTKKSFEEAMKETIGAIISSPDFLFVNKLSYKSDQPELLNAYELASRLANFLWGSIPDEELLSLAESGELLKENFLEQQTLRMLKDKKVKYLSHGFAMQWLNLKQLMSVSPDKELFRNFYYDKRYFQQHVGQFSIIEPLLLFETILVEDRSILDFIDSNYAYLNNPMNSWYGLKNFEVDKKVGNRSWKRMSLPDRRRGGLVTTSAFLSMTSVPTRSSPVNRGAWITSVLFNSPPPPPPADVPPLDEDDSSKEFTTIRERFEEHRKNPNCASCHNKIDPLGFSLENYNAVGQWRTHYENKLPVDASGVYNKSKFKDVVSFKDLLLKNKKRFTKGFVEHMMAFSLNREVEITDRASIDKIVSKVEQSGNKFSEVILGIVKSYSFRNKVKESK